MTMSAFLGTHSECSVPWVPEISLAYFRGAVSSRVFESARKVSGTQGNCSEKEKRRYLKTYVVTLPRAE